MKFWLIANTFFAGLCLTVTLGCAQTAIIQAQTQTPETKAAPAPTPSTESQPQPSNATAPTAVDSPAPSTPPAATSTPLPSVTPVVEATAPVAAAPQVTPVASAKSTEDKDGFVWGGNLYLAFENWSRITSTGDSKSSDSKIGYGLGGTLGFGIKLDDAKFMIGPHFSFNEWSVNYTKMNDESQTSRIYVRMNDTGLAMITYFDDIYLEIGSGSATASAGMVVNGDEVTTTGDSKAFSYTSVSIGMKMDWMLFAIGSTNYSGYAKYFDHINFMFGLAF